MKKIFILIAVYNIVATALHAQNINTIAGGLGDGGMATAAELYQPNGVAVDKFGNVYVADQGNHLIRKIEPSGIISIFAGIPGASVPSPGPFGGLSVNAAIGAPVSVATDTFGNVFIGDAGSAKIYKVDINGVINVYATGVGTQYGMATDKTGNLYVAENISSKIKKVNLAGTVTVIAGTGIAGFSGDGGLATAALIDHPVGVCADGSGNIFFSDNNNRIRKIDNSGIISTYAGNGGIGYTGDGGPATAANFNMAYGLSVDTSGNLYVADNNNNEIRKISTSGIITKVAGIFLSGGYSGDGGPATACQLYYPKATACDNSGNVFIADYTNNRIRKIDASGTISTVAGSNFHSSSGHKGDGGPEISALFATPFALAYDTAGNMYVADAGGYNIRKINSAGIISTIAGVDTAGYTGDGGPATSASFYYPVSLATDKKGNLFVSDEYNTVIRKINSAGIITTYAGYAGSGGFTGDGHRADSTVLIDPIGIACDKYGNLYIADNGDHKIRKVDTNQVMTTVAGTGVAGYFGDGGMASSAQLTYPEGVYIDGTGNIYVADWGNYRVRKINTSGLISTIAGTGIGSYSGDGGPALLAGVIPRNLTGDKNGNIFVIGGSRVRKINNSGVITTYAGNGSGGFSGDGGPATTAMIVGNYYYGMVTDTAGNLYIPDNGRIRQVGTSALTITTSNDTLCSGIGSFTFSASATLIPPGFTPYYHWQKNYIPVGTNSPTYVSSGLNNGDLILCYITNGPSDAKIATSNVIKILIITTPLVPAVSISATPGSFCLGTTTTCTATSANGGTAPVYDWFKNGIHTYTGNPYIVAPASGDVIYCKLTSNGYCLLHDTARSPNLSYSVSLPALPTVTYSVGPGTSLCTGILATCNATSTHGGTPVYQWFKNGVLTFTGNSLIFLPDSGDVLQCRLTSNASCITTDTAWSGTTLFSVYHPSDPVVGITIMPGDTICPKTLVTATVSLSLNGGSSPVYVWFWNNYNVGTGLSYSFKPGNGDRLRCLLVSNSTCLLSVDTAGSPATTFHTTIPDTASVNISISPSDTFCQGTNVLCTAIPTNAGPDPVYRWYRNSTYQDTGITQYLSAPNNGESAFCLLINKSGCYAKDSVFSPTVVFHVINKVNPTVDFSITPGNIVCAGTAIECNATSTFGGDTPIYDWYVNGNQLFTGNVFDYVPADRDVIKCNLTSNQWCISTPNATKSKTVYVDTIPTLTITSDPGPVVFRGTTVNFSANFAYGYGINWQFQWYKNNVPVPGATSYTYATSDFNYWDSIYCVATSDTICLGAIISNILYIDTHHGMKLYPNPNNGDFIINGNDDNANGDDVHIRIYNILGQLVYEQTAKFNAITFYAELNLRRQLPPGLYMARLHYNKTIIPIEFSIKY